MKVKDIIQFTEWMPNPQRSAETPKFSIMLPTYRRFQGGHLTRAIQSVLNQTYQNFELIIIDDGSVDGSFDEIQRFMKLDPRIHCLHHPRNVGLPAIGCYEAYVKSRAEYMMFCFDDTEYKKYALEKVEQYVSKHKPKIAFGYIDYQYAASNGELLHSYLGREKTSQAFLKMTNFLPNLGGIVHRSLPNEIGFLDPHPAVARLTDWDYWKRAAKSYELHYLDIHIGTEFGSVTRDSLGITYPLNQWMAYEWTEQDRNEALMPGKYEEYDVQLIPDELSDQSRLAILDLFNFYSDKFWRLPQQSFTILPRHSNDNLNQNARILVLTPMQDASVTLTFEHIRDARKIIRFVSPTQFDPQEMINASALVISRQLFGLEMQRWIEIAQQLRIPLYYYLDDNFIILSEELASLRDYSEKKMKKELRSFEAVLVTSPQLVTFFVERDIHTKIHLFPPIISRDPWLDHSSIQEKSPGTIRIGFMGGAHRSSDFSISVLPAIAQLAMEHEVELVIGGNHELLEDDYPQLKIYRFPFDISYRLALGRMQSADIDILVHAGSPTSNNPYKTHNVLLNAAMLQALPILANQPPYEEVEKLGLGLLCRDSEDWYMNLKRAVSDANMVSQMLENLYQFVHEHYSGAQNLEVLKLISNECAAPGAAVIDYRYRRYVNLLTSPPSDATYMDLLLAKGSVRLVHKLEYGLQPKAARWNGFSFMIGTHSKKAVGQIDIEIFDQARGTIVRHTSLDLSKISDNQIVDVDFEMIPDSNNRDFLIRFLLRSPDPQTTISIYEKNGMEPKLWRIMRRTGVLTRGNKLACRLFYEQ